MTSGRRWWRLSSWQIEWPTPRHEAPAVIDPPRRSRKHSIRVENSIRDASKNWSETDLSDLQHGIERGYRIPEIATVLIRADIEVWTKALELRLKIPAVG